MQIVKDKWGITLKYPQRTCKQCIRFPCMEMEHLRCDFAKYGCTDYSNTR